MGKVKQIIDSPIKRVEWVGWVETCVRLKTRPGGWFGWRRVVGNRGVVRKEINGHKTVQVIGNAVSTG